jgi:hypothetical protein
MPLRGRQRTRRYNNNAGAQRFFGIRVGRLFREIAAENGTRRAAALALCVFTVRVIPEGSDGTDDRPLTARQLNRRRPFDHRFDARC